MNEKPFEVKRVTAESDELILVLKSVYNKLKQTEHTQPFTENELELMIGWMSLAEANRERECVFPENEDNDLLKKIEVILAKLRMDKLSGK